MRKECIYPDNCYFGYLDDPVDSARKQEALIFWEKMKRGEYDIIISDVTIDEIMKYKNVERRNMRLLMLNEIDYKIVESNEEVVRIANLLKQINHLDH
jgi:hypothetical protein